MKVLKATQKEYNLLNNYTFNNSKLLFDKDLNNNWIVGEEVLKDESFAEIKEQLQALPLIEYKPKKTEV